MFFSEEKNQKTFMSCASGKIQAPAFQGWAGKWKRRKEPKVFCFFFSKKKSCL